jgi:hypothetical protein
LVFVSQAKNSRYFYSLQIPSIYTCILFCWIQCFTLSMLHNNLPRKNSALIGWDVYIVLVWQGNHFHHPCQKYSHLSSTVCHLDLHRHHQTILCIKKVWNNYYRCNMWIEITTTEVKWVKIFSYIMARTS